MDIPYYLRSSNRRRSSNLPHISIPFSMTTASHALPAAKVATVALAVTDARMDAKEQGQTTIAN
jgi:hypothetical protein